MADETTQLYFLPVNDSGGSPDLVLPSGGGQSQVFPGGGGLAPGTGGGAASGQVTPEPGSSMAPAPTTGNGGLVILGLIGLYIVIALLSSGKSKE